MFARLPWLVAFLGIMPVVFAAEPEAINGLNAEFFNDRIFNHLVVKQVVPNIDDYWNSASPAKGVDRNNFSVRWTGWIKAPAEGQYEFLVEANGGYRLWIDGQLIIDEWREGWHPKAASIELGPDPKKIKVEYLEASEWSGIVLRWRKVGTADPVVVPLEALFIEEGGAKTKQVKKQPYRTGLIAEYYDLGFKRRLAVDRVYRTTALWAEQRPFPNVPYDAGARYSGFLVPPKSGRYKFIAFADDSMKVLFDKKPFVDTKKEKGAVSSYIDLEAGKAYPLIIEYVDSDFWGSYYLQWIPPGEKVEQCIPPECLFPNKQSLPKGSL